MFFRKKTGLKIEKKSFDAENKKPAVKASICTGEKVAGFKDLEGGRFTEVMLIRTPKDEQRFREIYGLESVKKEY